MAVDRPSSRELPATLPSDDMDGDVFGDNGAAATFPPAVRGPHHRRIWVVGLGLPLLLAGASLAAWGLGTFETAPPAAIPVAKAAPLSLIHI